MEKLENRVVPLTAGALFCLLLVWVVLSPAESRLGNVVKLVYVHGALVWVGLLTFTLAGAFGLVALIARRPGWYRATWAAGRAGLVVWIVYAFSSMAVTGLTWGQVIAWSEPRVQASAFVLIAAVLVAAATHMVDHPDFTAGVNVAMGAAVWIVVRQAEVIRHPVDPIGGSGSAAIQLYYALIFATVALLAGTLVAWLWARASLRDERVEYPRDEVLRRLG